MTTQVEFLIPAHLRNGEPILRALQSGAKVHGCSSILRRNYGGDTPWLVMYGVGHPTQAPIRKQHIDRGGRVVLLDAGYFDRPGPNGTMRASIDHDHPQHLLDQTSEDRKFPS